MKKQLTTISKTCPDCYGDVEMSECCGESVDGNRCLRCGRYCRIETCSNCNGDGYIEFEVGDNVLLFIYEELSPDYLIKSMKSLITKSNNGIFEGKITKIIDEQHVEVKIKKKLIEVDIDNIEQN